MKNYVALSIVAASIIVELAVAAPNPAATPKGPLDQKAFDDSFTKLPTNITSDTLTLRQDDRLFIYEGNVKVVQGDMTITSNTLEGTYDNDNKIQKLTAKGDVVIVKADITAKGQQAFYEAGPSTVTLVENPEVTQNKSILTADKIRIFLKENRSEAEGQVRVIMVNKDATPAPLSAATAAAALVTGTPAAAAPAAPAPAQPSPTVAVVAPTTKPAKPAK